MGKKNEVVTQNQYKDLNTEGLKKFKKDYQTLGVKMLDLAMQADRLSRQNQDEFVRFCKEEMSLSKATVSKLITSGRIINNNPDLILPKEYSKVYELAPVQENIEDFAKYADEQLPEGKDLSTATQKELRTLVKTYNDGDIDSEIVEEEAVEAVEEAVEEAEEESEGEVVEEETVNELKEKYGEVAQNCIEILSAYEADEEHTDCVATLRAILQEIGVL